MPRLSRAFPREKNTGAPRIVGLEAETEALQGAHDAGAAELARQEALWREAEEELNCAQVSLFFF